MSAFPFEPPTGARFCLCLDVQDCEPSQPFLPFAYLPPNPLAFFLPPTKEKVPTGPAIRHVTLQRPNQNEGYYKK